jgi:hypothetical protein
MRLFVSVLFGLLAELLTGVVIGAGMVMTGHSMSESKSGQLPGWVPIVAIVAGSIFTFTIARWRAGRDVDRAMAHALLVAVAAVAFHLATSVGAGRPFTALHAVADVLKLVAGAAAGAMARRSASTPLSS